MSALSFLDLSDHSQERVIFIHGQGDCRHSHHSLVGRAMLMTAITLSAARAISLLVILYQGLALILLASCRSLSSLDLEQPLEDVPHCLSCSRQA